MHARSFRINILTSLSRITSKTIAKWCLLLYNCQTDGQLVELYLLEQKNKQNEMPLRTKKYSLPAYQVVMERWEWRFFWG